MEKFNIKSFKDIELADKAVFDKYLPLAGYQCCEFNFPNFFNWRHSYNIQWLISGDMLLIYNKTEDIMLMPVAARRPDADEMKFISDTFAAEGLSGTIVQVPAEYMGKNPGIEKLFKVTTSSDIDEYIYLTEKLINLSGSKLHKKKNLISQFVRNNNSYSVRILTGNDKEKCLAFTKKWQLTKNVDPEHIDEEDLAINSAFDNFDVLGIEGLGIFIDDEMIAYSVFGRQTAEMYLTYFEKSDRDIKGAAQMINWETAKYLDGKCKYINREQDIGDEGLRHAKSSYDPIYMLKNYELERIK